MSRYPLVSLCSAIALLLLPATANARTLTIVDLLDMPLERLAKVEVMITGASKYAERIIEAPSIVEVITAEDIKTYGYKTLADALNGMHGVYATNDRNHTTLGVRGFSLSSTPNSRILIMIDGHRMNDNVYDSAYVGREFMLDMELVDHIEYIPGPGSSIYGANAMMGIINVVTKKGSDINGTQIMGSVGGGSHETGEARVTYGKAFDNGADVIVSASGYATPGVENLYYPVYTGVAYTNFGYARNLDEEDSKSLFAKVQYGDFTYQYGFVNRFRQTPTGAYSTYFGKPGYNVDEDQYFGEVRYKKALTEKTSLDAKAYYHWYDSVTYWPYDCGAFICPYASTYEGNWAGAEATFVTTAFDNHKIVVGGEFQYDFNQRLHDEFFGTQQNTNREGVRSGFYAQDAWTVNDRLVLNAGFRVDQHHMMDDVQVNPRLGVIWNPKPSTTVKLLYGAAFRAPDVWETDYDFGVPGTTEPREEHIRNYEGVMEWRGDNGLKISGSAFYNDFSDMITKDYNPVSPTYLQYVNTGSLESIGFDLNGEKKWDNGREVKFNYNHTEYIEHTGTNWGNVDAPKNVAKLRYSEPVWNGRAKLGIEDVFVGKRLTMYYSTYSQAYHLVNVNLTSGSLFNDILPPGTDVSVGIYNLLDQEVNMVGGPPHIMDRIPMNGTSFVISARKTFE